jgi:peptidoglycan/xylan/chitin deacetylase (PgdA/CDA1 family)
MNKFLFILLRISGLPFLFRELIQRKKVTILLLHDASVEAAEQTFSYLSKKYNIIDLNEFIDAIDKRDKTRIPKKALILTFDDGYIRNYEMLPIIKKYNVPVTIFLCASIISSNRHFWFKYKHQSISTERLKHLPNKERLNILSKVGFEQDKEFDKPQALQRSHIYEMKNSVNIQSHTLFHPILPKCDYVEAREEIFHSKEILEKDYKLEINAISYPNGDYSERDILLAKEAGYKCGITVDFGFNSIKTNAFKLKRLSVNDTANLNELVVKASGVWWFLKRGFGLKNKIER